MFSTTAKLQLLLLNQFVQLLSKAINSHNRLLSLPRTLFLKEMSGYGKKIQLPTTIQFDVKFFIFFLLHISRELIDE
ncbi:MAG: hypothetical protein EB003_08470 [Flavobacteriia bacterium]|nr:hypothetical protein [Flavobacteriia bacterium]